MSLFTKTANDVFAPYNSDGSPREPVPQEAQVWGTEVERSLLAFQAGGGIIFETKAEMDAALNYTANQSAWVMGDDTVENNGVYRKIGASGVGSWERLGDLPYSFIRATDVGAGTPNAIQATTSIPVSGAALIWMNVFEANTASPVIVSFNGGSPLTIKTNSGNDVAAGGLTSGMIVMGIVSGSTFRLVSDQASSAIVAAAEAAADRAEAAAAAADGVGTPVAVWPSGTLRTMKERATDTYHILDAPGAADPAGVNDSTAAFEAMLADPSAIRCVVSFGDYILTRKLVVPDCVSLEGQGGNYEFLGKTRLLFAGTGAKEHSIPGATLRSVANPDAGAAYLVDSGTRGNAYTILDLTSPMSAAIILGKASVLKNFGVHPFFQGILGYLGTSYLLSDDWDIGVWARNADRALVENVSSFGHWRKYAGLISNHDIGDGKVPSGEMVKLRNSNFQGYRGLGIRTAETIVGSNYGFAGTAIEDCLVRGLNHQSLHLATSSMLATPFSAPSAAFEISGGAMRGIQVSRTQFFNRDDIMMNFGKCSEITFSQCYLEGKSIKANGNWLDNSDSSRMVATADAVGIKFRNGAGNYVVDYSPGQTRDSSLAGKRYTAPGVFNPGTHDDEDYRQRTFGSYIGDRMRKSTDRRIIEDENGVAQIIFDAAGRIQSSLLLSGTITIADDAAASIPTPKKGGHMVITCCGSTENGNFPDPLRSGQVIYDAGAAAFGATKEYGGANFIGVNTDVTGTTGTDGNVTIGAILDNVRIENRAGSAQVFRYVFVG